MPRTHLVTAVAIALAESGGNPRAACYNTGHGCSSHPFAGQKSVDRCLWQINDRAHPWSTRGNIYNPLACAHAAVRISHGGTDWRPWSTYVSGSYRRHLAAARAAVLQVIRKD